MRRHNYPRGFIFLGILFLFFQGNLVHAQTPTPIAREYFTFHNLVRNGSFESFDQAQGLPAQWTINDPSKVSLLSDPLQVKVGAVTVKLSGPVKFSQDIRDWKGLEASNVTLGVWIKGSSGDSVKFSVDDGISKQEKALSLTDTQWKFVTFKPATAVSGSAKYLKVELEILSTTEGISLDGVMLSQVTKGVAFVPNPDDQEKSPQDLIYTDTINGKVGIGTSTPQKELDVAGDIRASGKVYQGESEQQEEVLTKTAADDLYLNDDQDETLSRNLTVNGLLTSGSGKVLNDLEVTGLVKAGSFQGDGSGLTNILSQWKSSTDGTGIYFNQGNVGIGTTSPAQKLDVAGEVRINSGSGTGNIWRPDNAGLALKLGNGANVSFGAFEFSNGLGNVANMVVQEGGNVGIGTTSPAQKLDVAGEVRINSGSGTSNIWRPDNAGLALKLGNGSNVSFGAFEFSNGLGNVANMVVQEGGNVGIGTTAPREKLEVAGNIYVTGNINAKYQDVAEWVESEEELTPGTVVVLDSNSSNKVIASIEAYDTKVAGVVSHQPGLILGEGGQGKYMIAHTGRVKVKVDASFGVIEVGDLLVTSPVSGLAMKSEAVEIKGRAFHQPGTILGKALEVLKEGQGEILVLLSLQ